MRRECLQGGRTHHNCIGPDDYKTTLSGVDEVGGEGHKSVFRTLDEGTTFENPRSIARADTGWGNAETQSGRLNNRRSLSGRVCVGGHDEISKLIKIPQPRDPGVA